MLSVIKIRKSRLDLLKALKDHVKESLDYAEVNDALESDVAEMFIDIRDKRRLKSLKVMFKELGGWIDEMEDEKKGISESVVA